LEGFPKPIANKELILMVVFSDTTVSMGGMCLGAELLLLGNDTKASKLYSGSSALNDAKDPHWISWLPGMKKHQYLRKKPSKGDVGTLEVFAILAPCASSSSSS